MLSLGLIAFTQPWLLASLVALPGLWLLLRVTPPAARRVAFPPILLLRGLVSSERTPARTPWWLLLLRLVIAGLIILALAGPLLYPAPQLGGAGPVMLVVDDGWAAAAQWEQRRAVALEAIDQAGREGRAVILLPTSVDAERPLPKPMAADEARDAWPRLQPQPWTTDRRAAAAAVGRLGLEAATSVWLSDGLTDRRGEQEAAADLAATLAELGPLRIHAPAAAELAPLVDAASGGGQRLEAVVRQPGIGESRRFALRALGVEGETLARVEVALGPSEPSAPVSLDLPGEMRNRVARLELEPSTGAGGVVLLDERWRRRTVGIVGSPHAAAAQPLLTEGYFLDRAFRPFADVREGPLAELLQSPPSLLVLGDTGRIEGNARQSLERWMNDGGVALRFAGPRLAASDDDLVPSRLRPGDRALGGALSWAQPLRLAPFAADSPFAGLVPPDEVRVSRQVLAEPSPGLREATLAALEDGTPLVTGTRRGKGWLILVHTTANTTWTSLPLSGLFVDMLKRLLALAPGAGGELRGPLEPQRVLDGSGDLARQAPAVPAVDAGELGRQPAGPLRPPGLWGPVGTAPAARDEQPALVALNVQQGLDELAPLPPLSGATPQRYRRAAEVDAAPPLLTMAVLLALADLAIGLVLRGLVQRRPAAAAAAVLTLLIGAPAVAQESDAGLEVANQTKLGYVLTGDAEVDRESEAGLAGLTRVLAERTSVEAAPPTAVDLAQDDLAFYPLLYWPVPPDHPDLPGETLAKVGIYLRDGGMIIFDTRDGGVLIPGQEGGGPGETRLAQLLVGLDLPPLVPVPAEHVLTRSFYLLQDFPGRWAGQPLWVDQAAAGVNDGVSSVIVGANEWTGAWAEDEVGEPLHPVVPGGEDQRETARRFGVNLVMYALTGNYKTDQVHVPALLERLGQ